MKIVQVGTNKAFDDLSNYLLSNYEELEFGLFVEPNKLHTESIQKCYEKYLNIIIENTAIKTPLQNQDSLKIYYHTNDYPDYQLASCNIKHIEKHLWCPHLWRGGEGEIKNFEIPCITLEDLFEKYQIKELDWLYLDIEGIDAEVLLTFDWQKYKIKKVEFEYIHLEQYKNAIYNMMIGMGYEMVNSLHEYDWCFENKNINFGGQKNQDMKNLDVLFLGRNNSNEVWEYDFIMNELLPKDYNKIPEFMFWDDVKNTTKNFDIFVYSARDPNNYPWGWIPTYDEVLECVLKTKPKIIIQLSDEFKNEDLQVHNQLGNYCELFLRQYHHENYFYTLNTIHIPLAYKNGFDIKNKIIKPIKDREYNWSFVGTYKSDRQELIDCFSKIGNNKCIVRDESNSKIISPDQLVDYFIDSIFIPCSRGWSTIDTMRLYEASMSGAIPVLVSSKNELELVFKYEENPPWIFAQSWEEASNICKNLLENKEELQKMQDLILEWWKNRKGKLKDKIENYLIDMIIEKKLKNFPPVNFISIEESQDRRELLYDNFQKFGITNITSYIYKKYNDDEHKIIEGSTTLDFDARGPVTSHLKAIKEWYENTQEEYAFFCEDDLSFESLEYWNFTWEEFFSSLPKDWDCVQLCLVRENMFEYYYPDTDFKLRHRCFDDWSGCAYLIHRRHAKNLINSYYPEQSIHLEYKGTDREYRVQLSDAHWFLIPHMENLIYSCFDTGKIYTFPLFLEDIINFKSTRSTNNNWMNVKSYQEVLDWWKTKGKDFSLNQFIL